MTRPDASWPLRPAERDWTAARLLVVLMVTAAAPWFFLIGGAIGLYLDLRMGTAAMLAGGLIGTGLVAAAVVPMATRYAIDQVAGAVPQLGTRGVLLVIVPQYLSILGWNATLLVFFGDNIARLGLLAGLSGTTSAAVVPVATALACMLCYPVLRIGAAGIERVCQALVLFIAAVAAWLVWLLLVEHSQAIAAAKPHLASPDLWWNYVAGIEILIATNLSWWAYLGAIVRHVERPSQAFLPTMLGLGLTLPLLSIIGLAAQLALGSTDPSGWLATFGGPAYGAVALTLVALSNFGTVLAGTYAAALGLKQVPGLGRAGWNALCLASLLPLLILSTVFADAVKTHFTTFLACIGLAFGPICGIQIADYLLLRRQQLSLAGIYARGAGTPYHFWHGLNPAGAAALAAGCGVYLTILDPLSFATAPIFVWTTASLPSALAAGVVHLALTRTVIQPAGWGNYPRV